MYLSIYLFIYLLIYLFIYVFIYLLLALEMDYLRRLARVSRLEKISYITIRSKIQLESKEGELKWYGNLLRMDGNRWPKMIYQWSPHGK